MVMTWYSQREGKGSHGYMTISIYATGQVAISAELTRCIPTDLKFFQVGYDAATRTLALKFLSTQESGAARCAKMNQGRGVMGSIRTALRSFGLWPFPSDSWQKIPAEWKDPMIVAQLPTRE